MAAPRKAPAGPRIGLALAGGGPLGAIYEIGALCALQEALDGVDFNDLSGYVGVSAGGFIAAGLANGMTPRQLCSAFIENDSARQDLVRPAQFIRPAWGEYLRRGAALPGLLVQAGLRAVFKRRALLSAVEMLGGRRGGRHPLAAPAMRDHGSHHRHPARHHELQRQGEAKHGEESADRKRDAHHQEIEGAGDDLRANEHRGENPPDPVVGHAPSECTQRQNRRIRHFAIVARAAIWRARGANRRKALRLHRQSRYNVRSIFFLNHCFAAGLRWPHNPPPCPSTNTAATNACTRSKRCKSSPILRS